MIYEKRLSGDWIGAFERQGVLVVREFYSQEDCQLTLQLLHDLFRAEGIDPAEPNNLIGVHQRYLSLWPTIVDRP